jgi:hypothetical protein
MHGLLSPKNFGCTVFAFDSRGIGGRGILEHIHGLQGRTFVNRLRQWSNQSSYHWNLRRRHNHAVLFAFIALSNHWRTSSAFSLATDSAVLFRGEKSGCSPNIGLEEQALP